MIAQRGSVHTRSRAGFYQAAHRWLLFVLPCMCLLLAAAAGADEVRLKCVADTNLSAYPTEVELNYGRSTHLRLKGVEMLALLRFDLGPVKGMHIRRATLFLRYAGADRKLRVLGFSTVAVPWQEGTGAGERKEGECCFKARALGKEDWAWPGSDFTDVSYTAGNTVAAYAAIHEENDGWISAPVDPRIVQAMIAGVSWGMAVSDETGETRANNDVCSREVAGSEPYLMVEVEKSQEENPGPLPGARAEPDASQADFQSGAVRITLTAPSHAFGYAVRALTSSADLGVLLPQWELPLAEPGKEQSFVIPGLPPSGPVTLLLAARSETGKLGPSAVVRCKASPALTLPPPLTVPPPELALAVAPPAGPLQVWAYPDTCKAHPISGNLLEEVGMAAYAGVPAGSYRNHNAVWAGGRIQLQGARGEMLGFHLLIASDVPRSGITVEAPARFSNASSGHSITPVITLYRDWYVKDGEWMPEACVPLSSSLDIPAPDNNIPGQRNQSVFVDLFIPPNTPTGTYYASFVVRAPGLADVKVPAVLRVTPLVLPDRCSFDVSLNTYGTVGHLFGISDATPAYLALERSYHRMAHMHRATLAVLGYSHSGRISTGYAPPLEGTGANRHVADWSAWDAHFGPYLGGSAFADLPWPSAPITHMYLPFHEDWPADIRRYYHYTPTTDRYPDIIVEHALKAPPIEEAMDPAFALEFKAVLDDFARHIVQMGWTQTRFQLYLNNKYYYRDPAMGGQGTSWWLLDEPNHRDDWLALAYFARLLRDARRGWKSPAPIIFREDVSRPQWQRDTLDGLVDLMVVGGGEFFNRTRRLAEMKRKWGVQFWTYGSCNEVRESNVAAEVWAVRAWLAGADGIVPWQTVGDDAAFEKPEATAILLPGKRFGLLGPIASERLKALRRAEQDVEYLALLQQAKGWTRRQVAAAVAPLLHVEAAFVPGSEEDAGRLHVQRARAEDFVNMRTAIAAALEQGR
ncbi:MAG: hypothetical protein ACP5VE_04955 [Chthonomonadales bacterium]